MVVIPAAKGKTPQTAETANVDTTMNFLLEPSSLQLVALKSIDGFFCSLIRFECHKLFRIKNI
jgi:hypothetical protein